MSDQNEQQLPLETDPPTQATPDTTAAPQPAPSKQKMPLDDRKKNALLRYLAVLFGVAFLLIMLSYLIQVRDSRLTITQLNQSNSSALQNAGKLQDENRALLDQTKELELKLYDMEDELETASSELESLSEVTEENAKLKEHLSETQKAYDLLLSASEKQRTGNIDGCQEDLNQLTSLKPLLSASALKEFDRLTAACAAETAS